jgi:hypothetical protein
LILGEHALRAQVAEAKTELAEAVEQKDKEEEEATRGEAE